MYGEYAYDFQKTFRSFEHLNVPSVHVSLFRWLDKTIEVLQKVSVF